MQQPMQQFIPREDYPEWKDGEPFPLVRAIFNLANIALNSDPVERRCLLERLERRHGLPVVMHVQEVIRKYEPRRPEGDSAGAQRARRRARVGIIDPSAFHADALGGYGRAS